jgi:hypothetical protein
MAGSPRRCNLGCGHVEEAVLALHAEKRDLAERLLEGTDVVGD